MVPKGAFGFQRVRVNDSTDREISIRIDRSCGISGDHRDTMARKGAGEGQFAHVLGEGHHRCERHRWVPAEGDRHGKGFASDEGLLMVDTDPAMELVMQTDLLVGDVFVTGELDPIHTEIAMGQVRWLIR